MQSNRKIIHFWLRFCTSEVNGYFFLNSVERQRTTDCYDGAWRAEEKPLQQSLQDRIVLAEQQQIRTREWPEKSDGPSARNARLSFVVEFVL